MFPCNYVILFYCEAWAGQETLSLVKEKKKKQFNNEMITTQSGGQIFETFDMQNVLHHLWQYAPLWRSATGSKDSQLDYKTNFPR